MRWKDDSEYMKERIWKEAAVGYLKVDFNFSIRLEGEKYEKPVGMSGTRPTVVSVLQQ
jgi:hypothetical protein